MQSILEALLNGKVNLWELPSVRTEKHYHLLRELEKKEEYFKATLSLKDYEEFCKFSEIHSELMAEEELHKNCLVFGIGLQLMYDVTKRIEKLYGD